MFFRMKAADDTVIDYEKAVKGGLVLIPQGEDMDALRADYQSMIDEGLLLEDVHDFDELITQCTYYKRKLIGQFDRGRKSSANSGFSDSCSPGLKECPEVEEVYWRIGTPPSAPAILAFHSSGPVWWTLVPLESTATVTGISTTSNS